MISLRRLDLNPTSHIFNLRYMWVDRMPEPDFSSSSWKSRSEKTYDNKPLIWEEGVHEFGPIISKELNTDNGIIIWRDFDNHEKASVESYLFIIKYECETTPLGYKIKVYTKSSYRIHKFGISRYMDKRYTILNDNEIPEIMHQIASDNNKVPLTSTFCYSYDSNKSNL